MFSYQFDGTLWCFDIKAKDEAEAKARVARLYYAKYDGEVMMDLPAQMAPVGRFYVFLRNLLSSPYQRP